MAAAASTTRWERTGGPGSAFSGLGRGRGSRGRGGHRGGRGSRINPTREQTVEDNANKSPPPQVPQPMQSPVAEKPTRPNVKPARQPSRGDPSPHQAPGSRATPSPTSITRSSNRRRRPQPSKSNANDPKVSPSASADSQHLALQSSLTKDRPPHLQHRTGMRHDIDALVERVRAVAMDNRPTTPGSHIDWAGDDDDTLPDLNDWGVTTTLGPEGSETISPIVLEGLKPLPDVATPPTASPLRQVTTLVNPAIGDNKANVVENETSSSVSNTPQVLKDLDIDPQMKLEGSQQSLPRKPACPPHPSNRKPWHPSLPAKPPVGSLVSRMNMRPVATPMRHPVYTKPSPTTHKEGSLPKEVQSTQATTENSSGPVLVEGVLATVKPDEKNFDSERPKPEDNRLPKSAASCQVDPIVPASETDSDDDSKREGLGASIHAPYLSSQLKSQVWAHRSQSGRLKQRNERNGLESGLSFRDESLSNGAGSPNSHHRIHASRPIITGDAMSRLARTIGQTNSAS